MLKVTDAAAQHLNTLLFEAPPTAAIRFVLNDNQLQPQIDNAREGDVAYKCGDRPVLFVGPQMAEMLGERTLDTQKSEQGPRLVLTEPRPEAT
ncbi:MAG: hypothetical protein RIK87_29305 [Fuerstiella sp.]